MGSGRAHLSVLQPVSLPLLAPGDYNGSFNGQGNLGIKNGSYNGVENEGNNNGVENGVPTFPLDCLQCSGVCCCCVACSWRAVCAACHTAACPPSALQFPLRLPPPPRGAGNAAGNANRGISNGVDNGVQNTGNSNGIANGSLNEGDYNGNSNGYRNEGAAGLVMQRSACKHRQCIRRPSVPPPPLQLKPR